MTMQAAQQIDNGIAPGYLHYPKIVVPAAPVSAAGAHFKWYAIYEPNRPIPADITERARAAVASGRAEGRGLGFVILHRCGESFYFLLVSSWRESNELWETVFYRDAGMTDFAPFPREGMQKPTFCVWELGAVWHEQQAWSHFLRSERTPADVEAWLVDRMNGEV